jgi:hypothetical protein
MRRARPRLSNADAQLTGEFGMRRSHKRGHLFLPRLDKLDLAFGTLQGAEHAIDAVAWIAEDAPNAPLIKALDKESRRQS